jgi:hypothetical protein
MEAARDIFYNIYGDGKRSGIIDDLLRELDFHALSITLLATTASHNRWDFNRLKKEWETHRTQVLRTHYNGSLAARIELSLASPTLSLSSRKGSTRTTSIGYLQLSRMGYASWTRFALYP